jgi:hypothetical protein
MLHILACTPKHLLDLHQMLLKSNFQCVCHGQLVVVLQL